MHVLWALWDDSKDYRHLQTIKNNMVSNYPLISVRGASHTTECKLAISRLTTTFAAQASAGRHTRTGYEPLADPDVGPNIEL